MVKIKLTILLLFTCIGLALCQSVDRYVVFFTDKVNTPFNIAAPEQFLTDKAINRLGRVITEEDLPIDPNYVAGVVAAGATFMHTLKWFNGMIGEINSADTATIGALSYVLAYEIVAPGGKPNPGGRSNGKIEKGKREREELLQMELLGTTNMHNDGFMGQQMSVAVMDAGFEGVDMNNYFSKIYDENRLIMAINLVTSSTDVYEHSTHGSKVFSTIAANIENSYVGVAPMADFYLFVTEDGDSEYRIEEYNWTVAAEKADSAGVDIITTSLGYSTFDDNSMDYAITDLDGQTAIITQAAEKAFEKGIFVVASAGNEGNKSWVNVTPPADGEHILSVGSIGDDLLISDFSSTGPVQGGRIKPDVVAVGGPATLVSSTSTIITGNGTSFAAPQVAGLMAGLWQKYPEMNNQELFDMVIASASQANNPDNSYGHGIPNYVRFTNMVEGITAIENVIAANEFKLFPNPLSGSELVILKGGKPLIGSNVVQIFNTNGSLFYRGELSYNLSTNETRIPMESAPAGLYIVQIITSKEMHSYKLVKQ